MKKTIILLGIASVLLISCGKDENKDPQPNTNNTETETKDTVVTETAKSQIVINDTIIHSANKGTRTPTNSYSVYTFAAGADGYNTFQITTETKTITSGTYNVVNWGKSNLGLAANEAVVTYQVLSPFATYRSKVGGTIQVTVTGDVVKFKFDKIDFTNDYGAGALISADVEAVK